VLPLQKARLSLRQTEVDFLIEIALSTPTGMNPTDTLRTLNRYLDDHPLGGWWSKPRREVVGIRTLAPVGRAPLNSPCRPEPPLKVGSVKGRGALASGLLLSVGGAAVTRDPNLSAIANPL
jgi:hypothetical protein